MQFFRNPEITKSIIIYMILTAVLAAAGLFVSPACAMLLFCAGICFLCLHLLITRSRYGRIVQMSRKIDRILHGQEETAFSDYREGELAILQNELNKMVVRLREQADQLRKDKVSLQDSIADISHQLKTPLTSMNLLLSLLDNPKLTYEQRFSYVKELERDISHIDWLVATLLKISQIDAGTVRFSKESVDVEKLVQAAASPLEVPMELREQRLLVEVGEHVAFCGDFLWTVEAVRNILKNCMEHTPPGGQIKVSAAENPVFTEMVITDTGEGIAPEDLPHLFERFYKGKNSGEKSVGIGLALARMIVTAQEGTLKAGNRKEGGARFIMRFYKSVV